MKDYKRLTNNNLEEYNPEYDFCVGCKYFGEPNGCNRPNGTCDDYERFNETYNRLAELEDKIESGELCDRKEMAREILRMIKDKGLFRYGGYLLHDSDFDTISKLYGVEAKYERL